MQFKFERHKELMPVLMRLTAPSGRVYCLHAETWEWRDDCEWNWTRDILQGDNTAAGTMEVTVDGKIVGKVFNMPYAYDKSYTVCMNPIRWHGDLPTDQFDGTFQDAVGFLTPMSALVRFVHGAEAFFELHAKQGALKCQSKLPLAGSQL